MTKFDRIVISCYGAMLMLALPALIAANAIWHIH